MRLNDCCAKTLNVTSNSTQCSVTILPGEIHDCHMNLTVFKTINFISNIVSHLSFWLLCGDEVSCAKFVLYFV
jgi:hypothetical protein